MFEDTFIEDNHFRLGKPALIHDIAAQEPDIAVDQNGTLWAVWCQRERTGDRICLAAYTRNMESTPLDISLRQGVEFQPTLAVLPNNTLLVVWVAFRDDCWHLISRTISDGRCGDEQILYSNSGGIFRPSMALGQDGAVWLAFEVVDNKSVHLVTSRNSEGAWQLADRLTTPEGSCYRPALSVGPNNGMWIAYDVYHNGHYEVCLQRVDQPGQTLVVTHNDYHNLQAALACDNAGNLWIAWASNQNEAFRDQWWMTKWVYMRRFDGTCFEDPVGVPPGRDIYNEDSFQGWEFPALKVDQAGRVWIFGQSSHTLYAQYYAGSMWSPLYTIAHRHWGSWKPRARVAGQGPIFLATMGLQGAQLQALYPEPGSICPVVIAAQEPGAANVRQSERRVRRAIRSPDGETLNVYFGDLHAHSIYSDATNDVDEFYHRYRDAYGYDFATLTDHDYLDGIELSLSELKMIWNHCDRMTVPGEFVAMYGYEWTAPAIAEHALSGDTVGEGHRHIIYPAPNGPLVSYGEASANTGKKLLRRLHGVKALVIPHHTSWSGTDWDAHDGELQRLVEVCSTHGRFEYPGNKPIGYRRDHIHPHKFVLDALARGYRLGFVGGSDSHGLRWHATELADRDSYIAPGTRIGWKEDVYRTGMTAVLAPELTREALYDALYNRRCYATSGVPIVLDFRVNGHLMGSDIVVQEAPRISCMIEGTAPIRSVDIIRSGHVFGGLQCREGEGLTSLSFSLADTILIPGEQHYYYLRVSQEDGNMAWSSPIWVTYDNGSYHV